LLTGGEFNLLEIQALIFTAVEAKRNEIEEGLPQAAPQMLGAFIYNKKKRITSDVIYARAPMRLNGLF